MAKLLAELVRDLKSEGWENVNPRELYFLWAGLKKAERRQEIGAFMAGGVTFAATRALNITKVASLNLAGGAAYFFGKWVHNRSLGSSLDNIIALDGTLVQEKIIRKYPEDTRRMQLLCKFFILERIDIESRCYQRWRHRNCFGDNCILGQTRRQAYKWRMTKPKQVSGTVKLSFKDIIEGPLEYLFGHETISWMEIHHFNTWYASSLGMLEFDDWVDHDFIRLV
ncbi:hypothetical protein L6164_012746 [Bauhinia variegata]|uniref:Uncharacterized protein n=1 Tax=Bauhinia variegata TaxID=167791 RepID=A0ACB9PDT9_BAUVA|nr:hypothetical protein L6164_012746 [Bauhinia variegata]